jgi:hypothetical protein
MISGVVFCPKSKGEKALMQEILKTKETDIFR